MFDDELGAARGSAIRLGRLVAANHAAEKRSGCRKLILATEWADTHGDPTSPTGAEEPDRRRGQRLARPDVEEYVRLGGVGTPTVAETCPAELGLLQQQAVGSARCLIADALDLRHRLPRLWDRVIAGEVHAWKARAIAVRTRWLSARSAALVDDLIAGQVELNSWARFEKLLDATLLQSDPVAYHQRAADAAMQRGVWATDSTCGLRPMIARATTGDVAVCLAMVSRIADCLADEGDEDPTNMRRSKAIGVLANPAAALDLLLRHADQPDLPPGPWDFAPDPTGADPWDGDRPCRRGPEHADYHRPDPADSDYRDGQTPPDQPDHPEPDETNDLPAETPPRSRPQPNADTSVIAPPLDAPAQRGPLNRSDGEPDQPRRLPGGQIVLRSPSPAERNASRPAVQIVVHVTDQTLYGGNGIVRTDAGPMTLDQLRWSLTDTDATITLRPVLDPATVAPVDSYEIPLPMRRALQIRHPHTVFPYGNPGRTDIDHTRAYRRGGPPGQTDPGNLGPLTRTEHRAKTVGRWQCRQPEPGTYLWRSPHGWIAITTNQGTLMLGDTTYARSLWRAAARRGDRAA